MEKRKEKAEIPNDGVTNTVGSSWLILLSETALRTLQHRRFLMPAFLEQASFLQKGKWDQSKSRVFSSSASNSVIYQCDLSDDFYLVWEVDVVYVHPLKAYAQVIKIWDVVYTDKIKDIINSITVVHTTYAHELLTACKVRPENSSKKVLPIIFPSSAKGLERSQLKSNWVYNASDTQAIVATLRFIPLSRSLIACIQFGVKGEIPFLLSKQEYEVIEQKGSVLLLGRSGTGKTTCLVLRLHDSYKGRHIASFGHSDQGQFELNQIFVTVSPILCNRIQRYFLKLKAAMETSLSGRDSIEAAVSHAQKISLQDVTDSMLEEEDEDNMFSCIPDDFAVLCKEHFPLFVTYGKLMSMLKGTLIASIDDEAFMDHCNMSDSDSIEDEGVNRDNFPSEVKEMQRFFGCRRVVSYELFERAYWPRFDKRTASAFDSVLVWSEMMSLIKGSEMAVKTKEGHLSAEQYLNCSVRCFPTFQHDRGNLYEVFLQYENMKQQNFHVDLMDQVHYLYHMLDSKGYGGVPIHEVYCDEVQDLTISQIKLLQSVCKNPKGFFLAGDTAQTIARGSAFTFEEVSAMMFRTHQEQLQRRNLTNHHKAHLAPARMQLSDNYRSHGGILNLAASVIELIDTYFKGSIDSLKPDTALLTGPKPIFLEGCTHTSLHMDIFGEDKLQDNTVEFGADQVIIVRSQEVKQNVQRTFNTGLVLTIHEAKGMEFNDVLLFDFFNDSPADLKWRVFLPLTTKKDNKKPSFQEGKHAILCSELKHLYTAITRARKQLWLFDSNLDIRRPMLELWRSRNLIQLESKPVRLAKQSTPREWSQRGTIFFENRLYKEAKICFTKANDVERASLCEANILKQDAQESVDRGDMQQARNLFYQSAELFKSLGKLKSAAQALLSGEWYTEAGVIFFDIKDYDAAAKAFRLSKDYCRAAQCLEKLQKFTEAIEMYKEGCALETAINKMQDKNYLCKIDESVVIKVIKLYCIPLLKQVNHAPSHHSDKIQHVKRALSLLPVGQKREKLLIDYGYTSLIELLCERKDVSESQLYLDDAKMYSQHGQKQKAAELYLKAAETLSMKMTSQNQVATEKESRKLVDLSMECLLQALRSKIATVKPEYTAFRTCETKPKSENKLQTDADDQAIEDMFKVAKSLLQEAMQIYCKCHGLQDSDCKEPRGLDLRFSKGINLALMEIRELYAQLTGDLIDLQQCLEIYNSAEGEAWLDARMRALLILCYAYIEGKVAHAEWDYWANLQGKLIDIYTKIRTSLSDETEEKGKKLYLKCCERFFRVEHLEEERSYYLIAQNGINAPLIQLLQQWQANHKAEVITDETPLESVIPVWRASKTLSRNAMQLVLAKYLQEILHSGMQLAKKENMIKKPCRTYANLGVCSRGDSCRSFHSSTGASIKAYLMQLAKQTKFAHFQAKLAREISNHCTNEGDDMASVQSAMSLSRYWLERLQESLHIVSAFSTNSSVVSQVYQSSDMSKEGLTDLASRVWLNREYNDYNITSLLQAFYMIVQMGMNYIPVYCRRFTRAFKIDRHPLPIWLIPSNRGPFAWSMHANLFNIIKHSRDGDAGKLVWVGARYVNFLVTDGAEMACGKPWLLIWILEVVVAVSIAAKRKFHGITLPATMIYTFFYKQRTLCRNIIHSNDVFPFLLCTLCELAMRVWYQKVWPLQTEEEWFAGCLRIQTILVACSYHVDSTELNQLWCWMQEVNKEMSKARMHATYLPVVNSKTLDEFGKNMVNALNVTNEPLTAIHVEGLSEVPWSVKNTKIAFTVKNCGSIQEVQHKLYPTQTLYNLSSDGLDEENILQEENKYEATKEQKPVIGHEATLEQEIAAACILQSWVRKMQAAKQKRISRDNVWDEKFDHACLKSKTWTSARYRMWYLGLVMAKMYDVYKLHQSLESNKLKIRRNMANAAADIDSLDKLIDQDEKLREVKEEAERQLAALNVENERHAEANIEFLNAGCREAVKTLARARRLHLID